MYVSCPSEDQIHIFEHVLQIHIFECVVHSCHHLIVLACNVSTQFISVIDINDPLFNTS